MSTQAATIEELTQQVSAENLMRFTENVAKEVRLSGSPEELRAFEYVKQTLEGFGYTTSLLFSDAYISLPGQAKLLVNNEELPCITHSMVPPTGAQGLTGELVYCKKGTPADYQHQSVKGKVVLLDGLATPAAVKLAQDQGAAGVLFIHAKYTHEMIVSPVWGSPTPETVKHLPQIPAVSVNYDHGQQIKQKLDKSSVTVWFQTEVDTGWRPIPTLIAELKGQEEPEKFVMFSGHIDSWHYGAMDNGSANATMIETARIMAQYQAKLRRSLRLAFWSGHSHGRYAGSAWYCDTNFEDLHENCVLHINIDSVGAKGAVVLSEANCMAETRELGASAVEQHSTERYDGSRFGRAGDQSFWGTGIPSLFMGLSEQAPSGDPANQAFAQLFGGGKAGGFGWWWHTTEDTLDKIDPDNLVRDCKVYVSTVYRACAEQILPINQAAAVEEIANALSIYTDKSGGHIDFELTMERIQQLKQLTAEFNLAASQNTHAAGNSRLINETIMQLSRLLVPLNYVKGSIYEHDVALKQSAIPALEELDRFQQVAEYSDEYYQLRTLLRRRVNRVNHTLLQAIRKLENTLQQLAL